MCAGAYTNTNITTNLTTDSYAACTHATCANAYSSAYRPKSSSAWLPWWVNGGVYAFVPW